MSEPDDAACFDPTTLPLCTDATTLIDNLRLFGIICYPEMTGGREWPYVGACALADGGDTYLLMAELAMYLGLDVVNDDDGSPRTDGNLILRIADDGGAWLEHNGRELVRMINDGWEHWHQCAVDTGSVYLLLGCRPLFDDEDAFDYFFNTCDVDNTAFTSIPVKRIW